MWWAVTMSPLAPTVVGFLLAGGQLRVLELGHFRCTNHSTFMSIYLRAHSVVTTLSAGNKNFKFTSDTFPSTFILVKRRTGQTDCRVVFCGAVDRCTRNLTTLLDPAFHGLLGSSYLARSVTLGSVSLLSFSGKVNSLRGM